MPRRGQQDDVTARGHPLGGCGPEECRRDAGDACPSGVPRSPPPWDFARGDLEAEIPMMLGRMQSVTKESAEMLLTNSRRGRTR